jgi:signal transduction histidine kinase/ActR/RegA family two-component response regulator
VSPWRARQPLHRTLVTMALAVAATALVVAVAGLVVAEAWQYRDRAAGETQVLASVLAENSAAAVLFDDADEARQILASVAVHAAVRRACLYRTGAGLFAAFARGGGAPCPPAARPQSSWSMVAQVAPIVRNGRTVGEVHVERGLTDLWTSLLVASGTGLLMLLVAGLVAVPVANRLHRRISVPIVGLAAAARTFSGDTAGAAGPVVDTNIRELDELGAAFYEMLERVGDANRTLRRKEAEREELLRREQEASRLKDEFLAAVSHELRTPLSTIVTWVQVLSMRPPDHDTLTRGVAAIGRSAHAQARVIEDLVDVSRIVAGKLHLRHAILDLRDAIDAAIDLARDAAAAKHLALSVDLPAAPCLVLGDRDRLQQVFGNLLSNAVKFTPPDGHVAVSLATSGEFYDVQVTDDGIGIAPNFLPYVFDRFRQADGSMTREHGGLGLGLAIVKELSTLHGGSVAVQSAGRNRGATFTVRLPSVRGSVAEAEAAGDAAAEPPTDALAGVRVLAVDDNADALDAVQAALAAAGARVRVAGSGAEAVALAKADAPDVVLCDLSMPELDGFVVLRLLRAAVPPGRALPAIALSAHASAEHRRRSRAAGFAHHLAKPYQIDVLIDTIRASLTPEGRPSP